MFNDKEATTNQRTDLHEQSSLNIESYQADTI